jgi:hypothetical protein
MLQSLFYLTIALHVSGLIITHLQEHKTAVTTASGNRYTVIELNSCKVHISHLRQECHNSKFGIFELLV